MAAFSIVDLSGTAGQSNFTFSFPYLSQDHIHVYLDGVETSAFSFNSSFTIHLTTPLAADAVVRIQRITPIDEALVDFSNGSVLGEADLDAEALQLLYAVQESVDDQINSIHTDASGNWDFLGHRGVNAADPIDPQDVVTKQYSDDRTGTTSALEAQAALAAILAIDAIDVSIYMRTLLPADTAAEARGILEVTSLANPSHSGTMTGTFTIDGTGSYLITIQNITLANAVVSAEPTLALGVVPKQLLEKVGSKMITGLTYANAAGDVTNDITIAAGGAYDSTGLFWMALPSAITKQLDVNWVVGNNQGGLDTGAIANAKYYLWLIMRPDTGVVDVLFSLSATAPTMPSNYTKSRLIGFIERVGAAISLFTVYGLDGGGIELSWTAPPLSVDVAATLTTSRRTDALKVPLDFSTVAKITVSITDAAAASGVRVMCPDEADAAVSNTAAPLCNLVTQVAATAITAPMRVRTSATGTIAARATIATMDNYRVLTDGFIWDRK